MRRTILCALLVVGCTYSKKEHRAAELTGAIEATVTRVDRKAVTVAAIGGGHVGILVPAVEKSTECELTVRKPKALQIPVASPCDTTYSLAADPEGRRLAYAPPAGAYWSLIYFGTHGRSFAGLTFPPAGPIDWGSVPKLEETLIAQLRSAIVNEFNEHMKPVEKIGDLVFDEIIDTGGDRELVRALEETLGAPADADRFQPPGGHRAVWGRGLDRLKDASPVRTVLATKLAALKLDTDEAVNATTRAVLYSDLAVLPIEALARAGSRDASPAARYPIAVLLARLAGRDPRKAAEIGCALLDRIGPRKGEPLRSEADLVIALAAVANGHAKCAAVANVETAWEQTHDGAGCMRREWRCPRGEPDHVCTPAEVRAELSAFFGGTPAQLRRLEMYIDVAMTSASLTQGLPPARSKALERQLYKEDTPESAPACSVAKSGEHCQPSSLDESSMKSMCSAAAVASEAGRTIHFDDAKRRYWFTRAE